jgi:tyrosine-protein kinase Etk/Wzc
MTTLPQTSPVRYTRPATSGVPSLAGSGGAMGGGPIAPGTSMTASDVFRVLRQNLWLILAALVLSAIVGVALHFYLLRYHPKYTSQGWVQVGVPTVFDPIGTIKVPGLSDTTIEYEQRTQVQLLRSDGLWSDVLSQANNPIRETAWFRQFEQKSASSRGGEGTDAASLAKDDLEDNFSVTPIPDSKLILVSMRAPRAEDAKAIVSAITDAHLENQRRINNNRNNNEAALRRQLLTNYRQQLQAKQRQMADQEARLGSDGVQGGLGRGTLTVAELNLSQLLSQQLDIQSKHTAAKASLASMERNINGGIDPPAVERMVQNNFEILRYRNNIDELRVQIRMTAMEHGEGHRLVKQLESQLAEWLTKLDERTREYRVQARAELMEMSQQEVQTLEEDLVRIEGRISQIREELASRTSALTDFLSTRAEIEDLKEITQDLEQQVNAFTTAQQATPHVTWAQEPRTPDRRSFPKLPIVLTVAMLGGLALSLGIAFLREMMDTSVRSPRDIARVGQMNLLGMVPHEDDDPQTQGVPLALAISQAPQSIIAEQFRQVRTRLQHTASLETTRSILVTSPGPGDGKTTVAANLAAGLALNGRRILLVDANFRRPDLHKVFGVGNDKGFANVLGTGASIESAVTKTSVPNLDLLASGPKLANATELLEGQGLNEFIDRALEEYDHVIFDSGPILVVSETVALAPRVDGVVTVVRARTNSRGLLQRMRDALRQLKAEHLGVVLNGVRAQAGGYYNRNIKTYYAYQNGEK